MQAQYTNPRLHRRKAKFTPEEDAALAAVIAKYGTADWELIANHIPNRNPRQCRDRWYYFLSPEVSKEPWSPEEDNRLLQLYHQLGPKWVQIANMFPGRIDTHIKNRWLVLQRRYRRYGTYDPLENIKLPLLAGLANLEQMNGVSSPQYSTPEPSAHQSPVESETESESSQADEPQKQTWNADDIFNMWDEQLAEEWNFWDVSY